MPRPSATPKRASCGTLATMSAATSGYLGTVSEKQRMDTLDYDTLAATTLVHGSPETVIARLRALRDQTGLTSLLLHYPPSHGHEKTMQSPGSLPST